MVVRRRRGGSRRLPSLGQDFDRGHREYVEGLAEGHRLWLRTKPFNAPPNYELADCLHTFSHVVELLGLGVRAQILDAGCGPGWMSELLARCGYWVTGIDISEDMVEIARQRIERIPEEVAPGLEAVAEFHAMEVVDIPWTDRFDAAVMFDTMHHFDDELETMRVVLRALVPGGRLYIREGARPAPGSEAEENLIQEMRDHGTLESPFEPDYLVEVAQRAGFEDVRLLLEVDELVDLHDARQPLRFLRRFWRYRRGRGDVNTLIARKPFGLDVDSTRPIFAAEVRLATPWGKSTTPNERLLGVHVVNTGRAFWPAGSGYPFPHGVVTVGLYRLAESGERIDIARSALPQGVPPGGSADVVVRAPAGAISGLETRVDLVREGLAWFGDLESQPLVVPAEG